MSAAALWVGSFILTNWVIFAIGTFLWLLAKNRGNYAKTIKGRRKKVRAEIEKARKPKRRKAKTKTVTKYIFQPGFEPGTHVPGVYRVLSDGEIEWFETAHLRTPRTGLDAAFHAFNVVNDKNDDVTNMDFVFTDYIEDPALEEALFQLSLNTTETQRGYFTGRLRFLRLWQQDKSILDDDRKAWAMVWKDYQNDHQAYPRNPMKKGWDAMKAELTEYTLRETQRVPVKA